MLRDCGAALAMTGWRKVGTREGFRGLVTARLGTAGAVEEMLGHEVGLDEVEVDGIVGVFGVVAGEVIGVTGGEGVDFGEVADKEGFGGGLRATLSSSWSLRGLPLQSWRRSSQTQG